jgi:putative NIF3 family GTP cyclohydrolase 1 type 2
MMKKIQQTKKTNSVNRDVLSLFLDEYLQVARIKDYCPNGLQVQGKPVIKKLVSGVTASMALIGPKETEKF